MGQDVFNYHRTIKTYGRIRVNGRLNDPAASFQGKDSPVPIGREAGYDPDQI